MSQPEGGRWSPGALPSWPYKQGPLRIARPKALQRYARAQVQAQRPAGYRAALAQFENAFVDVEAEA
jgi:hypothetical protein